MVLRARLRHHQRYWNPISGYNEGQQKNKKVANREIWPRVVEIFQSCTVWMMNVTMKHHIVICGLIYESLKFSGRSRHVALNTT